MRTVNQLQRYVVLIILVMERIFQWIGIQSPYAMIPFFM